VTTSPLAEAERARLAALHRYGVLDTPREAPFDRLVRLAARVLGTPIAAVSLVDAERVWFKAEVGLGAVQVPRELAMCNRTIGHDGPVYELADTHADPTLAGNPLLAPPVGIRFYAGAALTTPDGFRIGTLCVIDRVARPALTAEQRATLVDLAGAVMTELERRATHDALRRLADELQERTAQLTEMARLARIGSWSWRAGDDAMEWSDETYDLFGVSRAGFTPTVEGFFGVLHPEDGPRARAAGWHAMQSSADLHVEVRVPLSGGRLRTIIWNGSVRRAADGTAQELRGYCQDVTERRETEAALRHGEKLRTLGQLTGGIAHEFNNLLTIVQANLEIALDETDHLADARPELEAARRAAAAGTELTTRLLSFARSEPLRSDVTDISTWLGPLRDMATRTLGSRYQMTLKTDPALPPVALDRSQLEGAVLNLILNARDAMPTGGAIAIETERMTVPPGARGALADLMPGSYAVVAVRDNGAGMPSEVAGRVFEPFFTTKPPGSGTGLGLSMVLSFARQSGGTTLIETAPGQGTVVRIVLPLG